MKEGEPLTSWQRCCLRHLRTIHSFLKLDAPNVLIAKEIVLLFRATMAHLGKDAAAAFTETIVEDAKSAYGLCQHDNCVEPVSSDRLCEKHNEEVMQSLERVDAENLELIDKRVRRQLAEQGREMTLEELRAERKRILEKMRLALKREGFDVPKEDLALIELLQDMRIGEQDEQE